MTTSYKTNTHEPLYRAGLSALAILTTLMFGAVAFAQDGSCETDADCDEGQTCEVVAVGECACPPCPQGEECTCDCGDPEEYSECVTPPLTCEADGDCPGGLTCVNDGGGSSDAPCLIDEDGNTDCGGGEDPLPEPDGPGYCEFIPDNCDSTADCAEGFECQLETAPCAGLCDPNGNCEDTCDDAEATGYCEPQQIECEADSDCPSSWTCYAFEFESCSGGGSTGSGCVCPGCTPGGDCPPCECDDEGDEPIMDPEECTSEVESYCLPEGWDEWVESGGGGRGGSDGGVATNESGGGSGGGTGAPDDPNDDNGGGDVFNGEGGDSGDDDEDNERANDGCAVSSTSSSTGAGGALVALMALGLGVVVARRRR